MGSANGTFRSGGEAFPSSRILSLLGTLPPFDYCQKEGKICIGFRSKGAKEALPMPLDYEKKSSTVLSVGPFQGTALCFRTKATE